jgi:hypothetical protein
MITYKKITKDANLGYKIQWVINGESKTTYARTPELANTIYKGLL